MEELFKKLEKLKSQKERFFQMIDNQELDIDQIDGNFRKFEKRVADLRNEFEVEDFLLFGAKGKE
jgi:hypothetical protein